MVIIITIITISTLLLLLLVAVVAREGSGNTCWSGRNLMKPNGSQTAVKVQKQAEWMLMLLPVLMMMLSPSSTTGRGLNGQPAGDRRAEGGSGARIRSRRGSDRSVGRGLLTLVVGAGSSLAGRESHQTGTSDNRRRPGRRRHLD